METNTPIYNEKSIRQILSSLPKGLHKVDRNQYIKNCIEVYKAGTVFNVRHTQLIRNSNFLIIQNHIQNN